MKKYFIIGLFLLLSSLFVSAGDVVVKNGELNVTQDFFVDTDTLHVDSTNNRVGIGDVTPGSKLIVYDTAAPQARFYGDWSGAAADPGHGSIQIGGTVNYALLEYDGSGGDVYIDNSFDNDAGDIIFRTKTAGTAVTGLTIRGSGNVGIGTTDPTEKLHIVDGNVRIDDSRMFTWGDTRTSIRGESTTDSIRFYNDNSETVRITSMGNVGIGTTSVTYPLEVVGNVSGISIWSDGNVSASGYVTRTSVFDKSKDAWDYVKDADDYLTEGDINHSKFYGYVGEFEITDYSRPEEEEYQEEECDGTTCENVTKTRIIYPYIKEEAGVDLGKEIDVLRQAVYELKTELCNKDDTYAWC